MNKIAIIGGSGAIGGAVVDYVSMTYPNAKIHVFSRHVIEYPTPYISHHVMDYMNEESIKNAADMSASGGGFDMVFVATGMLHKGDEIQPEKSLLDLNADKFHTIFQANTIFPALVAKYFVPYLNRNDRSYFAVLSARVGSITDNRLGGWYAYRASKAALNMIIKNIAIEVGRRHKDMVVVGLHPGTVDSDLSKPFQRNVDAGKLFDAHYSAECLVNVLTGLEPHDSGKCFAWDGVEIEP